MNPWLETWETGSESPSYVVVRRLEFFVHPIASFMGKLSPRGFESPPDEADPMARARLAASAPQLVRALLAVELQGKDVDFDTFGGASVDSCCPSCGWDNFCQTRHAPECILDAALTAAGLPDQASRDAARAELAKR